MILGQDRAIEILRSNLRSGRLHHGWIFSGPEGVGKFTTAVAFAKIMLDPDAGPNLTGDIKTDENSPAARMIEAHAHPDLHIIRKELARFSDNRELRDRKLMNIPLDVLREHMIGGKTGDDKIHEGAAYRTSALGQGKVFIIDEAELIDKWGQNALLKTLEEPPDRTYIFLITARPERLLPTVRSRCQHVRFGRLDPEAMARWFAQSGLELDESERAWIEIFCDGSPGVAQLAAEYGFHNWRAALEPMLAQLDRGEFPVVLGKELGELVEAFAQAWVKNNTNASKDAANKDGARHMLSLLASHARGNLHRACSAGVDSDSSLAIIDLLREAEFQLERNVNLKQLLENLIVQWAQAMSGAVRT